MAFLHFVFLGLGLLVLFIGSLFYGTIDLWKSSSGIVLPPRSYIGALLVSFAFVRQYVYYMVESALFLGIVVFGQKQIQPG